MDPQDDWKDQANQEADELLDETVDRYYGDKS